MKLLERFDSIDPRYIYLAMAIALIFPVLKPIGLPISIDQQPSLERYSTGLRAQSRRYRKFSMPRTAAALIQSWVRQLKAWFTHCMKRGVKVVGIASGTWIDPGLHGAHNLVPALEAKGISARYGEDWVMIGYRGGGMPVIRATRTISEDRGQRRLGRQ